MARILDRFNGWFDATADRYRGVIAWALDHRKTVVASDHRCLRRRHFVLFMTLESIFLPRLRPGRIPVELQDRPGRLYSETKNRMNAVLGVLKSMPEVEHTYATIGAKDTDTVRDAADLREARRSRANGSANRSRSRRYVRTELARVAGHYTQFSGRRATWMRRKPLMVSIRGDNIDLLKKYAAAFKEEMYRIPGIVDMEVSLEQDTPEFRLKVDREKAVDSGVMTSTIVRTVGALVGGQAVSTYEDEDGDAIDVRVRLPQASEAGPCPGGTASLERSPAGRAARPCAARRACHL